VVPVIPLALRLATAGRPTAKVVNESDSDAHAPPPAFPAKARKKYSVEGCSPPAWAAPPPPSTPAVAEASQAPGSVPPSTGPKKTVTSGISPPVDVTSTPKFAVVAPISVAARVVTVGASGRVSNATDGAAQVLPAGLVARTVK
jgi:hypothetical protein